MRRVNLFSMLLIAIGMLFIQSCATIFGGRHNALVFSNDMKLPAEAYVDGTLVGKADGKLIIPKKIIQHGSILEIRAEGYQSKEYLILLKPHAAYVVGDIFSGALPLFIDFGTGNILRPKPRKFEVNLQENN